MINNINIKPGYKLTEIGVIPEDWELNMLDDLTIKIGSGITPSGGEKVYKNEGRPFVRSQNIGWGRLLLDDIVFIDDETHQKFPNTEIKLNDVFLNISGASIGRSSYANEKLVGGNVNQHVCIIRTLAKSLNPIYLNLFLLSQFGQSQIDSFQSGGNRQGLNIGQIKTFKIPLPPTLNEQTAIANTLSDVDELISCLEKLIAKKKAIKQGAMQELLKPKDGWEVKKLGEVVEFINGKAHENFIVENGAYILVNSKYISSEGKVSKTTNNPFCLANKDDILMVMSDVPNGKAIAKCFLVGLDNTYTVNQRICILRTKSINSSFLCFVLNRHNYFLAFDDGVKQTNLSKQDIIEFRLKIPTNIEEQKKIAYTLLILNSEIKAMEKKLEKYKKIKLGMMQELLTGKVRLV